MIKRALDMVQVIQWECLQWFHFSLLFFNPKRTGRHMALWGTQ